MVSICFISHGVETYGLTKTVEGILKYNIQEEKEDYTVADTPPPMDIDPLLTGSYSGAPMKENIISNLRLPPPPLFSRQGVPHLFKLRSRNYLLLLFTDDGDIS